MGLGPSRGVTRVAPPLFGNAKGIGDWGLEWENGAVELCTPTPLPGRSPLERTVGWVSRWAARLQSAWWEPRLPRLALPAEAAVTLLGRSPDCDCVLSDDTVSRQHAALRHADGSWF